MIIVEKEHEEKADRKSYKDPFDVNVPEGNYPGTVDSGVESRSVIECSDFHIV